MVILHVGPLLDEIVIHVLIPDFERKCNTNPGFWPILGHFLADSLRVDIDL